MKHLFFVVSLFLLLTIPLRADLSMRIEYLDNTEKTELLSNIARWEIDGTNELFRLIAIDGTVLAQKHLYNDFRHVVFIDYNSGTIVSNDKTHQIISIYPNPTQNTLYIKGIQTGETVRIFTLNGQLLLSQTAGNEQLTLPVESLSNGIYLLQVGTEIVKFIKQ